MTNPALKALESFESDEAKREELGIKLSGVIGGLKAIRKSKAKSLPDDMLKTMIETITNARDYLLGLGEEDD